MCCGEVWCGDTTTFLILFDMTSFYLALLKYEPPTIPCSFLTTLYLLLTVHIIFLIIQWVLFFTQIMIRAAVPDVPRFVTIQKKRTEYIRSKVVDKVADEADPEVVRAANLIKIKVLADIHQSAPGI